MKRVRVWACVCVHFSCKGEGNFPSLAHGLIVASLDPLVREPAVLRLGLCGIFSPYIYDISPFVSSMNLILSLGHHQLVVSGQP